MFILGNDVCACSVWASGRSWVVYKQASVPLEVLELCDYGAEENIWLEKQISSRSLEDREDNLLSAGEQTVSNCRQTT